MPGKANSFRLNVHVRFLVIHKVFKEAPELNHSVVTAHEGRNELHHKLILRISFVPRQNHLDQQLRTF
jgi:hypothetical protein